MRARLSRLSLVFLAFSRSRRRVRAHRARRVDFTFSHMGVCVSVRTVERALADEAEIERERRVERFARSLDANDGRLILHGLLARADRVNRNQRIYPKPILRREVAAYDAGAVREGRAYGRLEHPSEADESVFRDVRASEASHRVLEMYWDDEGKTLFGYLEVTAETVDGREVREMYARGDVLGVSTRSWSGLETRSDGRVYVDDDLELLAFDLVRDPATASFNGPGAMLPVEGGRYAPPSRR